MALSESLVIRSTILQNWHGFALSFRQTAVRMSYCHSNPQSPHGGRREDSELCTGEHCMPLCSGGLGYVTSFRKAWLEHQLYTALSHLYDLEKRIWAMWFFFPLCQMWIYTCVLRIRWKRSHAISYGLAFKGIFQWGDRKTNSLQLKIFQVDHGVPVLQIGTDIWPTLKRLGCSWFPLTIRESM